jgi:hypothetical protein
VQARMLPRCLFEKRQEERSTAASLVRFQGSRCSLGGISPTTEHAKQHDSTAKLFLPRLGRRVDSHPSAIESDGPRLRRKINDQASVGNRATRYMILADGQNSRGGCVFHACSTATLDGSPSAERTHGRCRFTPFRAYLADLVPPVQSRPLVILSAEIPSPAHSTMKL